MTVLRNNNKAIMAGLLLVSGFVPSALAQLEEVIVTATKRAESVQSIGMAIDAYSADKMAEFGWTDITQVANQSPNLDIKYAWGNSMPIYTIRGVGMNSFQASDTPSVGLFIDEVFQSSIATMGAQLFDMERVEVLKGPQGALFGRNTNGGAVSYFSKRPSQETEGFIRADIGKYNRIELEGGAGGALTDTLSARLSFMSIQQGEGWVHDRTSGDDIGEVDLTSLRLQFLWEPSEDTSVNLKMFTNRDRSQPVYFEHIGFWKPGAPGTFCDSYAASGKSDPSECVDVLGYSDTDNDPYAGDYTNRPDTPINSDAVLENDGKGMTLSVEHSFGGISLTSLTSYQTYERYQPKESDANPALFLDFLFGSDISAFSQEIRLASNNDGGFNWIAGVVYAKDDVEESPPRIGYLDDYIGLRARLVYDQVRDSTSVYAQGEWELNNALTLTAGVRYIEESLDFTKEIAFLLPPNFDVENRLILATVPDLNLGVDGKLDSEEITWRLQLDYQMSDEILLYASASTGFKGGGFNGGLATNPRLSIPFLPEEVFALEAGFKSMLIDRTLRLNGALFVYDYEGLQAATPKVDEVLGTPLNFLTNLEAADVSGLELDVEWMPTNNLTFGLGLGYLDTENNDPGLNFNGPFGNSPRVLPNAPEINFNATVQYELPLESGATLRFFTDYVWQDDHYKEIVNNLEIEAQALWNARLSWMSPDGSWSASLWGKNLADEVYRVDTLTDPIGSGWGVYVNGMPRTFGVTARYNWGE